MNVKSDNIPDKFPTTQLVRQAFEHLADAVTSNDANAIADAACQLAQRGREAMKTQGRAPSPMPAGTGGPGRIQHPSLVDDPSSAIERVESAMKQLISRSDSLPALEALHAAVAEAIDPIVPGRDKASVAHDIVEFTLSCRQHLKELHEEFPQFFDD